MLSQWSNVIELAMKGSRWTRGTIEPIRGAESARGFLSSIFSFAASAQERSQ